MKVTQVSPNLTQITRFGGFNCFFVRESDGFTLIDTGLPGSVATILRAARDLTLPIRRVLLTHAHVDHVGSLDALHRQLPAAEVLMSERDARIMRGDKTLDFEEPQSPLAGQYPVCSTPADRFIRSGDRIESLEVIDTAGHTPGHLSFIDTRDRALIAGDAFQTRGGIAVSGVVRPLFPLPALATWHKLTAYQSAVRLRERRPSVLAVGHGPALRDPMAPMDAALSAALRDQLHV